jgi:carbohydrate kinase (thermoresistant glucokinase family)
MVIVVIGPAGSGKSTVGRALARVLGWRFIDADSRHSPDNVARIGRGEALTDEQRQPWLDAIADEIAAAVRARRPLVVACSALRRSYRAALVRCNPSHDAVRFVYLRVSRSELAERLASRVGHFAPPVLLTSQLATLEEPSVSERGVHTVDGEQPVDDVVAAIRDTLAV